MTKVTKKKNRKLKRQIRKTFGGLLMASAIVIAALPVQDVAANTDPTVTTQPNSKVWVWDDENDKPDTSVTGVTTEVINACQDTVPTVPADAKIYTSADERFQFAYYDKMAIILNYDSKVLSDSTLEIPSSMEAFRKYRTGTSEAFMCLVTESNEFMFYDYKEQAKDVNDRLLFTVPDIQYGDVIVEYSDGTTETFNVPSSATDKNIGDDIEVNESQVYLDSATNKYYFVTTKYVKSADGKTEEKIETKHWADPLIVVTQKPCLNTDLDKWKDKDDTELYYQIPGSETADKPYGDLAHPTNDAHFRINAAVRYIGKQHVEADGDNYKVGAKRTGVDEGVFANCANITNLIIGENLQGISANAFQGCATLSSVTLANGLNIIGNGAFANCVRLQEVNIADNANIRALGKNAFYNCPALTTFKMPVNVKVIGDNCFEGCEELQSIDLCGENELNTMLKCIGNEAFKDCISLGSIVFPKNYEESALSLGVFDGCEHLQYIKVLSDQMTFAADSAYTFENFQDKKSGSFYFWGPDTNPEGGVLNRSKIHQTANDEEITFKYYDKEIYEVVKKDEVKDSAGNVTVLGEFTYQVNNNNELVKVWKKDNPQNVELPKQVGPYGIVTIGKGSFNDICSIKSVTIPETVTYIGDEAFKGCHNLEVVWFDNATTITGIGTDAFRTQVVSCGPCSSFVNTKTPKLTFVGAMNYVGSDGQWQDTVPFVYAMTEANMINSNDQDKSWITCHSGWPTNMEVKYNYDYDTNEGGAELQSYPRYDNYTSEAKISAWVDSLPYVKMNPDKEIYDQASGKRVKIGEYYKKMVASAIANCAPGSTNTPTEEEQQLINAALNVVVPANVKSIKPGLFSGYYMDENGTVKQVEIIDSDGNTSPVEPDKKVETVILNGVDVVEPLTFTGCTALEKVDVIGATEIGDYAFGALEEISAEDGTIELSNECSSLQHVVLGSNITKTGLRPFRGCDNLTKIECLGTNMSYQDGLLFNLSNEGQGGKVLVECLPGRGETVGNYTVDANELVDVTGLQEEAFMDCDGIGKIDLSSSTVDVIPENCFRNTDGVNTIVLPDTVKNIEAESFRDSQLKLLTIPGSQAYIAKDAFATTAYLKVAPLEGSSTQHKIMFECIKGTTADRYANEDENWYINPVYDKVFLEYTVYFWDYPNYPDTSTKDLFYKTKVKDGEDAVPPTDTPVHEGYAFSRWTDYTNVSRDIDVYPVFGSNIYTVTFRDYDGTQIGEVQYIEEGKSAVPPADPEREGYTFDQWSMDWNNVTEDRTIIALYIDNSGDASRHVVTFYDYNGTVISQQNVNHGEAAVEPKSPTRTGYVFSGWVPSDFSTVEKDMSIVAYYDVDSDGDGKADGSGSGSGSGSSNSANATASPSPTASPSSSSSSDDVKKYTVSVSGGSGSGSYAAGTIVAINAFDRGTGQSFDKWTTSTAGVGFANANATSTTFTMPAANVAITATYKTGSGSSSSSGSSTTGSNGSSAANNSGTTVQVTKPGISNTNLAGATVSGSTDNFVVKVTEDQAATNAVVAALQARYGDISRIKYLPMDISLYDSTGRTKIADTSGITVNLTLPLPDELAQYAGNNKVAAVSNGALEDLNVRFTTVDGVPCVNFTATHFSPYVIYVDTANLTEGTVDATPKTGDPIHPKWFLALGLASMSLILFFKKDKVVVKTKTA